MSSDRQARLILSSGYIWGFCLVSANQAQIVPDNTLQNESSIIIEDGSIAPGQVVDLIKNGAIRGETVFHSFEEFNVLGDRQVYFANPNGIQQIVTRVTGNNPSNIFGRLGVNGNADLFLLNPNGILFGEDASLDLGGSFIGTTADSLVFDDDLVYSATNPETPPLLSVTIPEGIQFGANAGEIEVRGEGHNLDFNSSTLTPTGNAPLSGLQVPTGRTLALIGGEVNLNSGNLLASEGNIELAAIAQSGKIELEQDDSLFAFNYDEIDSFGDINLLQQSFLDVRGGRNFGSVELRGQDITLQSGSAIIASKLSPGRSQTKGEINFVATNSLNIINNASETFPSGVFTQIEQPFNNAGADINIRTNRLQLENNALIVGTVTNQGRGGNISIDGGQIDLSRDSANPSFYVFELASGQKIVIAAEDLRKAAQLESVESLMNSSSNSKRKPIEIYASNISTIRTADPNFDIPSACRLGDDNFVILGKGGIAENPNPVVEAQNWKINQSGKVELLALSPQKDISSLADFPHCLQD